MKHAAMGPWEYMAMGGLLAVVVGLAALAGWTWAAFVLAVASGVLLTVGCIAQGVRVGMRQHRDDRAIGGF